VSDAGIAVKSSIYDFIDGSDKVIIIVDCENTDPYKLCATLRNLDENRIKKIKKIFLYDDIHTVDIWRSLEVYIDIPVEYFLVERVKQGKSLVDISLSVGTCREYYENKVDSFIIVSSDSDYWALISSLSSARFLVMVEYDKCGPDIKNALSKSKIFYCHIDDFYSGNINNIKISALLKDARRYLKNVLHFNVNNMMDEVYGKTRISMTDAERRQFYTKYIKPMNVAIDDKGDVTLKI
jgi:DNA-binding XRE family transcriptional regulator